MSLEDTIVHSQLEVSDCTAELWLNGIPVTRIAASPTRIPIENTAVGQFLVPGRNLLELVFEPGSSPKTAKSERNERRFEKKRSASARLIRFREGDTGMAPDGELLGEVFYRWEDNSIDPRYFPETSSTEVDMGAAYGRWGWQDAPVLSDSEALRAEASAALGEVEAAIRGLHKDRFWKLTELQIRDVLRAYPAVTEEYLRSDLETMFEHYRNVRDPVLPRNPDNHDFRLVAGGRMLQCIDKDWSTSFKLRDPNDDGSSVSYSIFLARIEGQLRIVR